jgi:hypothetical protein
MILASPLAARSTRASVTPGVLPEASPDSLITLLPPRDAEVVRQDKGVAEAMEAAVNVDLIAAQGRLAETKAHIEVRKSEIEMLKAKVKLAKEQKNQTEQLDLEGQIKAKELQLRVLEARRDMRDAEAGLAEARRKAAQVASGFFDKELDLIGKRNDLLQMRSVPAGMTNLDGLMRLQNEIRDVERRCLEILKEVAEKEKSAAENEAGVLQLLAGPEKK